MIKQVLKTVLAGVLAGVALFMMPFILIKVLIVFLLIKTIIRLMGGGRRHRQIQWQYAHTHKFKNMNEEDRTAFIQKYGNRCGWYSKHETNDFNAPKNENKAKHL